MKNLQLGTTEQLVRMGLTWVGTATLGAGVAQGELYQGAVGGVVAIGSFVWWLYRERQVKK